MNIGSSFDVVSNGKSKSVIVIPDQALRVEKYAAQELQAHVGLASGVTLPIVGEKNGFGTDANPIYIGACQATAKGGIDLGLLPKNGYVVKVAEDQIVLAGKDEDGDPINDDTKSVGSLLAVYEWLDQNVKAKWLWPGDLGTFVPKSKTISSGPPGTQRGAPKLIHSRLRFTSGGYGKCKWDVFGADKATRYQHETNVWLRRHRFLRTESFEYGHAYEDYWQRFGKEHNEFFALREDGRRAPHDERFDLVQMCVSNEGLHKQIIADWLEQRKRSPDRPWINGCENDRRAEDKPCQCEICLSWDVAGTGPASKNPWLVGSDKERAEGHARNDQSVSDRYAKFWLALQAEGRKHDAKATVLGLAYAGYTDPPFKTKLNDHIIVGIVPPYFFPIDKESKETFRALWDGWENTGARLFLRPNYTLEGYCLPYIYTEQLAEEYRYAQARGMIATDFDSLTGMYGVQGPTLYLLAKLNEGGDESTNEILEEYYSAFGTAREKIKEYFKYWEWVTLKKDRTFDTSHEGGWSVMSHSGDDIYTPEIFKKGSEILSEALEQAAGDTEAISRVEYLKTWLTHAQLAVNVLAAYHAARKDPSNSALRSKQLEEQATLDAFRMQHVDAFSATNLPLLHQLEIWAGWRRPTSEK